MSQINIAVDALPPGAQIYQYVLLDVPGVVANNNYLSVFNPVGNYKTFVFLALNASSYAMGTSSTANSMSAYRITTVSGGTSVLSSKITKYDTQQSVSTADVRTGNPTVTQLTGTPLLFIPPPFATGSGGGGQIFLTPPSGTAPLGHPGEGIVFNTVAGNANEVWSVQLIWAEF